MYATMAPIDFSRDVLELQANRLRLMVVAALRLDRFRHAATRRSHRSAPLGCRDHCAAGVAGGGAALFRSGRRGRLGPGGRRSLPFDSPSTPRRLPRARPNRPSAYSSSRMMAAKMSLFAALACRRFWAIIGLVHRRFVRSFLVVSRHPHIRRGVAPRRRRFRSLRGRHGHFLRARPALFFFGTFAPALRASDKPMAIACLRLFTVFPDRPLFSLPRFHLMHGAFDLAIGTLSFGSHSFLRAIFAS